MENCLHCGTKLEHVPGRKQKSFCNVNCRNKYFYAERQKLIKAALKFTTPVEKDTKELLNGNTIVYAEATPESYDGSKVTNAANEKRIAELRNELKNPPKNPLIGLRKWIAVRENEIKQLERNDTK